MHNAQGAFTQKGERGKDEGKKRKNDGYATIDESRPRWNSFLLALTSEIMRVIWIISVRYVFGNVLAGLMSIGGTLDFFFISRNEND